MDKKGQFQRVPRLVCNERVKKVARREDYQAFAETSRSMSSTSCVTSQTSAIVAAMTCLVAANVA